MADNKQSIQFTDDIANSPASEASLQSQTDQPLQPAQPASNLQTDQSTQLSKIDLTETTQEPDVPLTTEAKLQEEVKAVEDKIDDKVIPEKKDELKEKAEQLGIEYITKLPKDIEKDVLNIITQEVAQKYKMAVIGREGDEITVAMVNPEDIQGLNILQFIAEREKLSTKMVLVSEDVFSEVLSLYAGADVAVKEVMESLREDETGVGEKALKAVGEETLQSAPVAKLVQVIIKHAVDGRASDIHIEPVSDEYRVRFRVDGVLHSSLVFPIDVGRAVVSRIKILSNLKIDEKRKPQDGRFKVKERGKSIDFRVSTLPVVEGEKAVLRILTKEEKLLDLHSLGLLGLNYENLSGVLEEPFGMVLVTGPTGSGKSTSLYAFLSILNQEERNIITLEDPVEYFMDGVNQSQVNPEIGYTFASGLRSILRQDPNIIMVGEIRDGETAELAVHAALTGHIVFSTLHTNDSIGAIPRLVDMGLEPFLIASSLKAVAAQRLVRRTCQECKEEVEMPERIVESVKKEVENLPQGEVEKYELDLSKGLKFYKGKGCDACGGTGLKGRIAIYESFVVDLEMQQVIAETGGEENKMLEVINKRGMVTMKQDGLLKVLRGETVLSEVERVTEGSLSVGGDIEDI